MHRTCITPPMGMGDRLTQLMWDADISDSQLARMVKTDRRTISAYKYGDRTMNVTLCMKICAVLKTTPNYLILGKE